MNPFADVTYMTVNAWRDLDWRMVYEGLEGGWVPIELDDYYHQWMRQGHPRPLSQRIGILRRAWIVFPDAVQTTTLESLPAESAVMEHWVQLRHDGVRCRYASEAYARHIEGQVRVFRTLPDCLAGEGGTPPEEARALAPPAYHPPHETARHLWSVDPGTENDMSIMRHPIERRSPRHLYVKWQEADEGAFLVDRDELERSGYVEPKMGFPSHKTLYAAREFAEALLDPEALAQWRRQGLEEDLRERGRSRFDIVKFYVAMVFGPRHRQQWAQAEEYINGPKIYSA
jgi:hypothetical protein